MIASRLPVRDSVRTLVWEEAPCPLCDGEQHDVAFEAADPNTPNGLIFAVVRCRNCGMHFTNPRPDAESIGAFYPVNYKPHRQTGKPHRQASRWGWLTGNDCPERRGQLGREPGRLLDFGCGGGSYLERMHRLGWEVTGLDASDDAVERVRTDLGLDAVLGTLPHEDLEPCAFDAITMWHSLEHVHDPRDVLSAAFELLTPGGLIVIACPNLEGTPARWFGPDWFGLDLPRHLTHFTKRTLHEMLQVSGFRVLRIRGIKHSDWIRGSSRIARSHGKHGLMNRITTRKMASKFFAWLTYLANSCDCLLAVAERPE